MSLQKNKKITATVLVLSFFFVIAFTNSYADTAIKSNSKKRMYFKVYAGSTENETHNADLYDINTTDTTAAFGGGIKISDNFFLDGRIGLLGNYETPDNLYKEEFSAVTVSILGSLPVGSGFNIYGSIGYGLLTWEYTVSNFIRVEDTGDTITGGLGIQYQIPGREDFAVSLGYDTYYFRTETFFSGEEHNNTINYTSINIQYWFR